MAYWDFLQMTPENQAAARNMSWGQALKSEIPGTSNYRGYNPFYKGADATGLGGYLKQGGQSLVGNFQQGSNVGGATPLMRKLAMSPVSKYGMGALRFAGLTNPATLAATAAITTPSIINALTEREDPNITGMYGLNISDLEKKAMAFDAGAIEADGTKAMPGATLDDWASPFGNVPVAGDDIQEQVTETQTIDPYTGRSMRDISGEIGEYGDKPGEGFNEAMFYQEPGMWDRFKTPVMAGLEWLGDKFQRPEAKQKEFEMYEQTKGPQGWGDFGDYKGNIWEGSGGNKINVVDPVTGATILQNKNFDSMFGSDSVEEMIAKKEAWARKRRAKGEEYLSKELNAWLDAIDQGKGGTGDGSPQGGPDRTYGGPPTKSWNPNITSKPTHMGAGPLHGVTTSSRTPHHSRAQGGYMRSRYNKGGRVGILAAF